MHIIYYIELYVIFEEIMYCIAFYMYLLFEGK